MTSIIAFDGAPEKSRATLEELATGISRTWRVRDILPDHSELALIKHDYVVLENNGVRKRLHFNADAGRNLPMDPGYRRIGDNEFDLNPYGVFRGEADRVLDFSMNVHARDGGMAGIRISGVRSGTLAETLGLREGDVLLEVNGRPVDSILNSVRACMNAYGSDDLQLSVLRDGRRVPLTYHLFWEGEGAWTPKDVLNSRAVSSLFDDVSLSNLF